MTSRSRNIAGEKCEWAANWPIVLAAAAGMALSTLHVYSTGVFIAPLESAFGWKRTEISAGLTIVSVVGIVSSTFMGILIDRIGPRRIGVFGGAIFCASVGMLALAGPSIWSWFALWTVIAFSSTAIKPTVWAAAVSSVFVKGRGLALSVMLCGTGLGSSLTPIVSNYLIVHHGWRAAYVGLAVFWGVLALPILFFLFTSARDRDRTAKVVQAVGMAPAVTGLTIREGLRSMRFYILALAAFLISLVAVSFSVNLVPILVSTGIGSTKAADLAGLIGIATIVGRLSGGYFIDRVNGNLVAATSVLFPIVASALLLASPGSMAVAAAASIAVGLSLGAELDAVAYLATRHLGMRSFGALFGTIAGMLSLSVGIGPLLVSYAYDSTHSYVSVLWAYVPLCLVAAGLFLSLGNYPDFERSDA